MQFPPVPMLCAPGVRARAWPVVALALLASGCATLDVPQQAFHAPTAQKSLQSVHHWDVLAQDMAARVADKTRDWPTGEYPIYVAATSDSRFHTAFRKLLMARLTDRGLAVATEPSAALHLVVEAQLVQHLRADSSALAFVPLAAGLSVARDGVRHHALAAPKHAPTGVPPAAALYAREAAALGGESTAQGEGASLVASPPPSPAGRSAAVTAEAVLHPAPGLPGRSELLVTASLENGGRFLFGTTDVYSLVHDDALLYMASEPRPAPPPGPATKTWQVVSP